MKIEYNAILTPDDGKIGVEFPDLPGCITFGNTVEHALEMAREALDGWLEVQMVRNMPVPEPGELEGDNTYAVRPSASVAVPVWLRYQRERKSMTQTDVAKALGVSQAAYAKMEKVGSSNLRLSTIEKLERVFGEPVLAI